MLRYFEYLDIFTKLGIFTASFSNFLLIYLTLFYIRQIRGTYKQMVVILALTGIAFSSWELLARPFAHNYNRAFVFFSLNTQNSLFLVQISVAVYAGFYLFILAFFVVQFVFRYVSLVNPISTRKFGGFGCILWMGYPLICGGVYGGLLSWAGSPDEYSDDYLRNTFLDSYDLDITQTARFVLIPYASDDSLRWRNLSFIICGGSLLTVQYVIIIICAIKMHSAMERELRKFSVRNRSVQRQFFRALIVQTLVPTFLFVVPAMPLLMGPLFDIEWDLQTGGIIALLSVYPPIDSFVFIMIVSEYRKVVSNGLCRRKKISNHSTDVFII